MARKLYVKIDGKYQWVDLDEKPTEQAAPAVRADTLLSPIKHPVTGKMYDSVSAYEKDCRAQGFEIVGNEKLSQKPRRLKDKISEEKVMDAIYRAESFHSEPARTRAWRNEQQERLERFRKLVHEQRR